jgi:hypothetical protein
VYYILYSDSIRALTLGNCFFSGEGAGGCGAGAGGREGGGEGGGGSLGADEASQSCRYGNEDVCV